MTRNDALKIRNFLSWIFDKEEKQYLHAAIAKSYPSLDVDEWTIYVYGDHQESSFVVEAATLFKALDCICSSFQSSIGHYDAGTTEPDIRCAATLR